MRTTILIATLMLAVASAATLLRPARMMVDGVKAAAQDQADDAPVTAEALADLRRAAERGDASSQNSLGALYETGRGVPQDLTEAASWYRRAAEQGHADGQFNLALAYALGRGVPQDRRTAAAWYQRAATQGHASAQFLLGQAYARGRGIGQDYSAAAAWYRRAAEQGDVSAQINLGYAYAQGHGVLQDYVEAHMWFNVASSGSRFPEGRAGQARDDLARRMTREQIAEAQRRASEWFENNR